MSGKTTAILDRLFQTFGPARSFSVTDDFNEGTRTITVEHDDGHRTFVLRGRTGEVLAADPPEAARIPFDRDVFRDVLLNGDWADGE
jgi:hypothetical protein